VGFVRACAALHALRPLRSIARLTQTLQRGTGAGQRRGALPARGARVQACVCLVCASCAHAARCCRPSETRRARAIGMRVASRGGTQQRPARLHACAPDCRFRPCIPSVYRRDREVGRCHRRAQTAEQRGQKINKPTAGPRNCARGARHIYSGGIRKFLFCWFIVNSIGQWIAKTQ
jgi:hypothetical protein